jgi:diguanylate cyclase (GGDEF)-like protein
MTRRPLRPLHVLLLATLVTSPAVATAQEAAPEAIASPADEATASRCMQLRSREPAAAIEFADSALAELQLRPRNDEEARARAAFEIKLHACRGRAAAVTGDEERASGSAARIDALLAAHEMPAEFTLRALSNAGATLHQAGRVHEALDFYLRTLDVARREESDIAQVSALVNVASIHSEELGAYEEAEEFFARAAAADIGTADQRAILAYNRGENFLRLQRRDEARESFETALARAGEGGHDVVRQRARAELLALGAGEDPADTRAALEDIARNQRDGIQDPSGAATTWVRLSALALEAGDAASALRHAGAARAAAAEGNFRAEQRDALQAEVAALAALGRWQEAWQGAEALRVLEVERLRALNLSGLAGLQARLQDARDARELERVQEARRLEMLQDQQDRRMRNGALVGLLILALLAGAFMLYQRRVNARLTVLSTVDPLTGLLNRRAAEAHLGGPEFAARNEERVSVVYLVDVDHFKEHNDRHGHAAGDRILREIARRLRSACRPDDVVARWGGEEFVVGCHGLDAARAGIVAERLRNAARGAAADAAEGRPVTVSIGFASLPFLPDAERPGGWQDAIKLADRALYAAKHSGRDRWVGLWGPSGREGDPMDVLRDPPGHAATGEVDVLASETPVSWPPAPG